MAYVPRYDDHWNTSGWYKKPPPPSITIHVLKENLRPVGFAPWPAEPKPKKKPKRKKGRA